MLNSRQEIRHFSVTSWKGGGEVGVDNPQHIVYDTSASPAEEWGSGWGTQIHNTFCARHIRHVRRWTQTHGTYMVQGRSVKGNMIHAGQFIERKLL